MQPKGKYNRNINNNSITTSWFIFVILRNPVCHISTNFC